MASMRRSDFSKNPPAGFDRIGDNLQKDSNRCGGIWDSQNPKKTRSNRSFGRQVKALACGGSRKAGSIGWSRFFIGRMNCHSG
jgi:hypothetical protein